MNQLFIQALATVQSFTVGANTCIWQFFAVLPATMIGQECNISSNSMRQNLSINIFENGRESRDFVHASDVTRAVSLALATDLPTVTIANVGTGIATPVLEVATLLRDQVGSTSEVKVAGDFRAGDIRHWYADLTNMHKLLGFAPAVALASGLRAFCDWVTTQAVLEDRSAQAKQEPARAGLGHSST